jgi:hypothetical protein
MKKILITFSIVLIYTSSIRAQEVKNVSSEIIGNIIQIDYDLSSTKYNQIFNISLYVSFDGGNTFQGPMKSVSGDVGKGIKAGSNRINWEPFNDVPSLEGDVVFSIKAEVINQKLEKHFFVHYSGSYSLRDAGFSTPFGLSIGQIGKVGWYVTARMNTDAFSKSQYDFDGTDVIDYDKELYYEYDNEYKYPSLEALAGVTVQVHWNIFLYGGVGYAYQKYYWHINEYDYMDNSLQGDSYLDYTDYSVSGITAEAGIIIRAKMLSFNVGYSTLNFSYSNIVFGIGLNF